MSPEAYVAACVVLALAGVTLLFVSVVGCLVLRLHQQAASTRASSLQPVASAYAIESES